MASSLLACSFVFVLFLLSSAAASPVFYESFEESWEGRWVVSEKGDYQGKWKHEKSEGHEDHGLLVSEKAKKYGIAVDLPESIELMKNTVVLQYDLRLQNGLECGGAYLKFLQPQETGWAPKQFDNDSPYSIMFGPDKCGSTNKVHFIFRHKNPKTGAYVEHHLKYPPSPVIDKLSHVYSAIIFANNTLKILIDGVEKKTANLLSSDFEPPVVPAKTIADPDDVKPEDWDERAKIPDPDAKKPDDWDEEAPMEIEDMEAEKPEGWLDDELEEVEDPDAVKPEDWDDDEDGEWEAPKVPNPKCEDAPGCGEWERPKKRNPAYKGKWRPPMIDNPDYKGIWKPQQIPNPDYFELESPDLEPIAAIGIEIWTMQDGILFDNILITSDETAALEYREKWKAKYDVEKQQEEKPVPTAEAGAFGVFKTKVFESLRQAANNAPFLASQRPRIIELINHGEENSNVTIAVLAALLLVFISIFYKLLCGRKRTLETASVERAKKEDISTPDDSPPEKEVETEESAVQNDDEPSGEIEKDGEGVPGARPRRIRRET